MIKCHLNLETRRFNTANEINQANSDLAHNYMIIFLVILYGTLSFPNLSRLSQFQTTSTCLYKSSTLLSLGASFRRKFNSANCPLLGPVYMVSGTRDNPLPELPWARYFSTHLFKKCCQCLHELGETTRVGEASCLSSAGRVTLAGETTFSHANSLTRPPETRQQNLKCARMK